MSKEMCWLPYKGNESNIMLHLRENSDQSWIVYTRSPYAVEDYKIPGGSKGWATFQKLRQIGWQIISAKEARSLTSLVKSAIGK